MLTEIVKNHRLIRDYYHLQVHAPEIAAGALPGQFVMVRLPGLHVDPLLRRPFSIMDGRADGHVDMLYRVVGRGTRIIAELAEGSKLDLHGPLGNGFRIKDEPHTALLAGGGVGIPPIYFLYRELCRRSNTSITAFLGGRTRDDIPLADRFTAQNSKRIITTDDGSAGFKGLVTEAMEAELSREFPDNPVIYACGPKGMLKAVALLAKKHSIPAQISMENYMGCGIGACLGCVVDTSSGKKTVCHDGPVFDAGDISWS